MFVMDRHASCPVVPLENLFISEYLSDMNEIVKHDFADYVVHFANYNELDVMRSHCFDAFFA